MARRIYGGVQSFAMLREGGYFYVDKTVFLRDWWNGESGTDAVTLITRPRRFGKTLMMSTVECFFSTKYAGRADLFDGLDVWNDAAMRAEQGAYPVIFLSLADLKPSCLDEMLKIFSTLITLVFNSWEELLLPGMNDKEREIYAAVRPGMDAAAAKGAVKFLCGLLERHFGKKVIVLLDEYDTPMQESWVKDFWPETVEFMRGFFNATFKTNPHLERALLTGVTRVSRESLFSDFNNLRVVTTTTEQYETAFGFTEEEVFAAMDEYGLTDRAGVKRMYDGFTFGKVPDIYNPWSVVSYLQEKSLRPWWANTSSNSLAGKLVRQGSAALKQDFMTLLEGGTIRAAIDEQIVFDQLDGSDEAVWSLLLASGYLKIISVEGGEGEEDGEYELALTNGEVRRTLAGLVEGWFRKNAAARGAYGNFLQALMQGDVRYMNRFMNDVAYACFSSFDTGTHPGRTEPERFYHGFVLGLLVDLRSSYIVTSNRESGFGRYDVMLEPRDPAKDPAFIFEFKVHDSYDEKSLEDTVAAALAQIESKGYAQQLIERGIPAGSIRKYGFAFEGKTVLIG